MSAINEVGIVPSLKMKIFEKFKFKPKVKEFISKYKDKLIDWKDFLLGIFSHGFLLSCMVWGFFYPSFLAKILSFGIAYYYINKEVPLWWMQMRARPR